MKWDLEERTEDAIVAYLTGEVGGEMRVYASYDFDEAQYPCAAVYAESTGPIAEEASWHDARAMVVQVAVMTEAAPEVDANGLTLVTARERNAQARSAVLNALCIDGLVAALVAQQVDDVAFSQAQVTSTTRTVDAGARAMITTVTLDVIAEPVTGS